jgi:hypothetical protein
VNIDVRDDDAADGVGALEEEEEEEEEEDAQASSRDCTWLLVVSLGSHCTYCSAVDRTDWVMEGVVDRFNDRDVRVGRRRRVGFERLNNMGEMGWGE